MEGEESMRDTVLGQELLESLGPQRGRSFGAGATGIIWARDEGGFQTPVSLL